MKFFAIFGAFWAIIGPFEHLYVGLATDQNVPKGAMLRLMANFYPFEYSYVGWWHPHCEPSCGLSTWVLCVTLDKLHGFGDAHRPRAKPKIR